MQPTPFTWNKMEKVTEQKLLISKDYSSLGQKKMCCSLSPNPVSQSSVNKVHVLESKEQEKSPCQMVTNASTKQYKAKFRPNHTKYINIQQVTLLGASFNWPLKLSDLKPYQKQKGTSVGGN